MSGGSSSTQTSEPAPDRRSADIGMVCSHKGELRPFLKRVDRQRSYSEGAMTVRGGFLRETTRLVIAEAGPGYAQQRAAAELLCTEHHPQWILSLGFSSALQPDLQAGDLVLANEICDTHGQSLPVKCTIQARKRIHVGRLLVADSRPATAADKAALYASSSALAVDTGSLAVAQVCQERSVRFLAIRSIVETADESLPEKAVSLVYRPDSRALGSAMGMLTGGLRNIAEMNTWRQRAKLSADNLDRFLAGIVDQIADLVEQKKYGAR